MSVRVMVTSCKGVEMPGRTSDLGAKDGLVYVVLDSGSAGSFPADRVRVVEDEDKDYPQIGMEHK